MKNYIRQSLTVKLGLGILLLAVPIFVASLGILFLESRHNVKVEAMERVKCELNTASQRISRYLSLVETATNVTDWLITENLTPDSLLGYSRRVVLLNGSIDGCSISVEPETFPQYGRHFSAYTVRKEDTITTVIEKPYDYFGKVWYKQPRTLGESCWVVYYDEADSLALTLDGMVASYSKPLYDREHRFVGIISTELALLRLSKIISELKPYPNSYFTMLGEEGRYYIHPDTAKLFKRTIYSDIDPRSQADLIALGHEMSERNEGTIRVFIGGEPCLVCYKPVHGTPWNLALVCPESDILEDYHQLTYIIVPLLVVGLLLIMLVCRIAVKHALSPLSTLVSQTQRIAAGSLTFGEVIPHSSRPDAVGQLQNSFALMQHSIERHLTDIQRINEETAQHNEQLKHASQLAEKSERQKALFVQNVTHQIRTPLNIVMGFAQVLNESITQLSEEELKNIAGMMDHNAKILYRMVLMLYDSSDTGATQALNYSDSTREEVSCNELAREAIAYTHQYFPDLPISFKTDIPDTLTISTNHLYLMRSFRELLFNAAKYSDGQHVSLHITATPDAVRYVFQDIGPGIAEEYLDILFQPFVKANELSEGLGLGLPLTKRHITRLDGTLTLDTSYHDGCRFIVDLPLVVR